MSWLTIAVNEQRYGSHAGHGEIAMAQKIRFARIKLLVRRESLQKRYTELQKLKEEIRLAEIAAKQSSPPGERLSA